MIPHDEAGSVVWSAEMAQAFGVASDLLANGDRIAARMAFKEAYTKAVNDARERGAPVSWSPSLGHDQRTRDAALMTAVEKGRLSIEQARSVSPMLPGPNADVAALSMSSVKRLGMPV